MYKFFLCFILVLFLSSCGDGDEDNTNYKQEMRSFVIDIANYARGFNSSFIIIPQNGQEILTENGLASGTPATPYIKAINGVGREDLYYGYNNDNEATPSDITDYMQGFLDLARSNNLKPLVIDYCWDQPKMYDSYIRNEEHGNISFAADHRNLDDIPVYPPEPHNANYVDITSLQLARNFLYLIEPSKFSSRQDFLDALKRTNYDVLIIDAFFGSDLLSYGDVQSLKTKAKGGKRLVIAYMSIGEAEDYRYYWNAAWKTNPPAWLAGENPDWKGNYKVKYWYKEWQNIIYGSDSSYTKKLIDAGFDGAYLDIIDAFEYFE